MRTNPMVEFPIVLLFLLVATGGIMGYLIGKK